jgi:hypothetical protein
MVVFERDVELAKHSEPFSGTQTDWLQRTICGVRIPKLPLCSTITANLDLIRVRVDLQFIKLQ